VVVISIDGLNPRALRALGAAGAGIMRDGASTLNARTDRDSTMTLPNHTGIVVSDERGVAPAPARPARSPACLDAQLPRFDAPHVAT
jgi:hypothetical protein